MALNFLSNSGVNGVKVFEIRYDLSSVKSRGVFRIRASFARIVTHFSTCRLDSKNLILRGSEHEASSTILKGSLVLILSEPLKVQNIRMELTGVSKLE